MGKHDEKKLQSADETPNAPPLVMTKEEFEQLAEQRIARSLERCADALEALAAKFAPPPVVRTLPGARSLPTCSRGHAMQPTDDYCQECEREKNPKARSGNSAA